MKKLYFTPDVTVEAFKTQDIITISLHTTQYVVKSAQQSDPLPRLDADAQEYGD